MRTQLTAAQQQVAELGNELTAKTTACEAAEEAARELEERCEAGAEALTEAQGEIDSKEAHYQNLLQQGATAFSELEV